MGFNGPGRRALRRVLRRDSGTRIQPKEEVFGRISLRTSGQKLRSGPPNPGKTSILERTARADIHEKNFGLKNFGLIFCSLGVLRRGFREGT